MGLGRISHRGPAKGWAKAMRQGIAGMGVTVTLTNIAWLIVTWAPNQGEPILTPACPEVGLPKAGLAAKGAPCPRKTIAATRLPDLRRGPDDAVVLRPPGAADRPHPLAMAVLSPLHRRPGVSQSELAEMLEVERATAGRMIDRMERRRWLVRRPDPADRRINRLYLTAEAEGVQAEMGRIAAAMLDDATASLAEGEREVLTDMLERVKARLQSMGPRRAGMDKSPVAP